MIHTATLPPVGGYVEVVIDGEHLYKNIHTGEVTDNPFPVSTNDELIAKLEHENILLRAQIQAMVDRNDFIEDCIAEMAEIVYA